MAIKFALAKIKRYKTGGPSSISKYSKFNVLSRFIRKATKIPKL